jgi:hypothetical protein
VVSWELQLLRDRFYCLSASALSPNHRPDNLAREQKRLLLSLLSTLAFVRFASFYLVISPLAGFPTS